MIRALIVIVLVAALPAPAQARSPAHGQYVKAARMLRDWRYDEARKQIAEISSRWPKAAETRFLKAELDFLEGRYKGALEKLDGLDDDAVQGHVGELRELVTSTMVATDGFTSKTSSGGNFEIWYQPGKDDVIVELAGDALEKAHAILSKDFGFTPTETIRVELLGASADLARVSTLTEEEIETTGTIALCKYGKLMLVSPRATLFGYPWMDTLVHELVHYYVSRMSHDEVPVWLHEGLARFQQTRWRLPPTTELSVTDEHLLAEALKKNKLISLDDMHPSMAKLPSAEAASLAFAEVYTMIGWIHGEVGYEGIRKIIDKVKGGKSARRAVAEVMDRRWRRVERDWKRHLRGRSLQTSRAFAGRAEGPRVRFDRGEGGEDNVGVDQVASEKARKYARLGGLLRARNMSEAASIEYEKALAHAPGDPLISGKLSRTYLELGNYTRAIELAKPLAEADPDDPVAATTLGVAYGATGDSARSAGSFEVALRINPFDPTVRCGLAGAYQELGKKALAQREQAACSTLRR